ncbi:MAG TPA: hypothetical protein VGN38_12415 [Caulobacteraceae bacterium]|jgi:hypothetical protein|nr:hypothetical protein [Caulobacteraceae bacterium]
MKTFALAAALAAGLAFGAQAETFTFSNTGILGASVVIPGPNGAVRIAGVADFKGPTVMAGRSLPTDDHCASWPALPGDIFETHGQCTFSDPTGAGYVRFGCNPAKAPTEANCVGGIWGTAGAYAGRSGTLAWHNKVSADGKSATAEGAGQWGD